MSSSSSSSVRVIPSTSSEGTWSEGPEASVSGLSFSGVPSPVNVKSQRDHEVMKSCHDVVLVVGKKALGPIRECYSIPKEYVLRTPSVEQQHYNAGSSEISISLDALEADIHFSLHPTIVECLLWWRISLSQMTPNSWRYLIAFLDECRGAGAMDLNALHRKPKMLSGKNPLAIGARGSSSEVEEIHIENTMKRPVESSVLDQVVAGRAGKRVKITVRKHKSYHDEGSSRGVSGKGACDLS
ncbi:hypothetical protein BHM03_00055298 [Ensete ventricosum]|nr:hypothetical protein BHM03_00055298 [Ensete ventricosum]